MPSLDWGLDVLQEYRPALTAQPDFDDFWARTLAEARAHDLAPELTPIDTPLQGVRAERLTYSGFGGQRISGLYLRPAAADGPLPVVLCYHGYGGGAELLHAYLPWLLLGCAVVAVDARGQAGATGEEAGYTGGAVGGWMTNGILDPAGYYFRRVYADCIRAVDFACGRSELDPTRLVATGGSQGGGLTIAVAGLDARIAYAMPDVPFLCHFERAVNISPAGPYVEVAAYCAKYPDSVEQVFRTLSYHDGLNFAARINPASRHLWSVGLWDDVCPPSTVYAAYNACPASAKEMAIYPYNKHEGGGQAQRARQIDWLAAALAEG